MIFFIIFLIVVAAVGIYFYATNAKARTWIIGIGAAVLAGGAAFWDSLKGLF